jgi:hypothetical protein
MMRVLLSWTKSQCRKKPFIQPVGCITDPWLRGNSSLLCIDTNSRNETNPTYISYAISHCDALQPFRYLFLSLFLSSYHFRSPSSGFCPPLSLIPVGIREAAILNDRYCIGLGKRVGEVELEVVTSHLQLKYRYFATSSCITIFFFCKIGSPPAFSPLQAGIIGSAFVSFSADNPGPEAVAQKLLAFPLQHMSLY